jgi:hypothetical protein
LRLHLFYFVDRLGKAIRMGFKGGHGGVIDKASNSALWSSEQKK